MRLLGLEFPCLMGPVKGWLENISDKDMFSLVWNVYHCLCVKCPKPTEEELDAQGHQSAMLVSLRAQTSRMDI